MQSENPGKTQSRWAVAFNLPNTITWIRLAASLVVFGLIAAEYFFSATMLFILAAGTDWLDGYLARKLNLLTVLGRILDPLVDKVIVCGTFIYLVAFPNSGVWPWMVVLIVGRELLVTGLRSQLETEGRDFSANFFGKAKMVLQSVAAPLCLFSLWWQQAWESLPTWLWGTRTAFVWAAMLATIFSGLVYVLAAIRPRPASS